MTILLICVAVIVGCKKEEVVQESKLSEFGERLKPLGYNVTLEQNFQNDAPLPGQYAMLQGAFELQGKPYESYKPIFFGLYEHEGLALTVGQISIGITDELKDLFACSVLTYNNFTSADPSKKKISEDNDLGALVDIPLEDVRICHDSDEANWFVMLIDGKNNAFKITMIRKVNMDVQ